MALPIVEATYGTPISVAPNGQGMPVTVSDNGYGMPAQFVVDGGAPVVLDWMLPFNPTLDLDFANDRGWRQGAVPGLASSFLTTTRASDAYAPNAAGVYTLFSSNVPRITDLGLLVEEARTNLFLQSGTPATQSITVVNGSVYTVSVVGAGSVTLSGAGSGTVSQGSPVTFTAGSTSLTCTTAGITGAFVNVNVELGSFATSPIRTAGAAATRAADLVTVTNPPAFGSAYTLFAQAVPLAPSAFSLQQNVIQVDAGSGAQRLVMRRVATSGGRLAALVGGAGGNILSSATEWPPNTRSKWATAVAAGDQASSVDGASPSTLSAASLPTTPTAIRLGSATALEFLNGWLERAGVFATTRLTNARLQGVTAP